MNKNCLNCKEAFEKKSNRQSFCSLKCRRAVKNQKRRTGLKAMSRKEKYIHRKKERKRQLRHRLIKSKALPYFIMLNNPRLRKDPGFKAFHKMISKEPKLKALIEKHYEKIKGKSSDLARFKWPK